MNVVIPNGFIPRDYQLPVFQFLENGGRRAYLRWHRRAGKDLTAINLISYFGVRRPGVYWHVLPTYKQGKKVAWQGKTKEGRPFLDAIPKELRIGEPNESELRLKFKSRPDPKTGEARESIYQVVGGDNYDSLVGTGSVGIVFSEWSLMDPRAWDYFRPILVENDGWAIFIFTPRGKNHAYAMEISVEDDPLWLVDKKTVEDTRMVPLSVIEQERKEGYSEEKIQSEYYVNYEAAVDGGVYTDQIRFMEQARRQQFACSRKWNPRLPVNTCWDIGVDDFTFVWFFQEEQDGNIYFIDTYYSSGHGIAHYCKQLASKPYMYKYHYGPWDLAVRNFDEEAKTRKQIFRENGVRMKVAPKRSLEDGIEMVQTLLPICHFNPEFCQYGIDSIKAYHREEGEETYRDKTGKIRKVFGAPVHDWSSHACDALRSYALQRSKYGSGTDTTKAIQKKLDREKEINDNYNDLE